MSAAGEIDPAIRRYRMADYVELLAPAAAEGDDIWCLRLILNEFGHFFCHSNTAERDILVGAEPEPFDRRWDAFLAGYTEFLCAAAGLQAPAWALEPGRYLDAGGWPAARSPTSGSGGSTRRRRSSPPTACTTPPSI